MKSQAKLFSFLLLGPLTLCQMLADNPQKTGEPAAMELTGFAHFIAGRPTGRAPWDTLEQTPIWLAHAEQCNRAWSRLERSQLSRIRTWSSIELKDVTAEPRAVFYPFGGPDFLYPNTFFPNASEYILVGLEPAGRLPEWHNFSEEDWNGYLAGVLTSLEEILNLTFFKTEEMKADLEEQEGSGQRDPPVPALFPRPHRARDPGHRTRLHTT
jgi:hypothetical protein